MSCGRLSALPIRKSALHGRCLPIASSQRIGGGDDEHHRRNQQAAGASRRAAPPDHSITQYPSSRARNPSRSPNRSTSSYAGRVASTSARSVSPGALAERLRPERQDREWAGVAAGLGRASGTARRRRLWRIVLNESQRALIAARLATLARGQHQTAPLAVWHPAKLLRSG